MTAKEKTSQKKKAYRGGILTSQTLRRYISGKTKLANLDNVTDKDERKNLLNLRRQYNYRIRKALLEKFIDIDRTLKDLRRLESWMDGRKYEEGIIKAITDKGKITNIRINELRKRFLKRRRPTLKKPLKFELAVECPHCNKTELHEVLLGIHGFYCIAPKENVRGVNYS